MRNLSRVIFVLVLLLLATSITAAGGPELGPFSTTGYTTNLFDNPFYDPSQPPGSSNPPLLPSEFVPLPSGHTKFHISAQGDPDFENPENDALCDDLYGSLFPPEYRPVSCQTVCFSFAGQACGTTGMFDGGSFSFEEWGVYYPQTAPVAIPQGLSVGANHGLLNVITDSGIAKMQFGGLAVITDFEAPTDLTAVGSFAVLGGTGDYKKLKGQGTYVGDANVVFTVDYDLCEGENCPEQCAVFGNDRLKVTKDKIEWRVANEGKYDLTVNSITLNWLESETLLDKVKLGGKTLDNAPLSLPSDDPDIDGLWSTTDLNDWDGNDKDIQIRSGKNAKLTFEFEDREISQEQSDYTFLVQFEQGCAVTFVAFPEE